MTSDHGDMQMEHQQHYKMVPYDASARVPLIIAAPGYASGTPHRRRRPRSSSTSSRRSSARGRRATRSPRASRDVPLARAAARARRRRRRRAARLLRVAIPRRQHRASWFRRAVARRPQAVAPGDATNAAAAPLDAVFDLRADPDENTLREPALHERPRSRRRRRADGAEIDYPRVAREVALYNWEQMHGWINRTGANWTARVRAA